MITRGIIAVALAAGAGALGALVHPLVAPVVFGVLLVAAVVASGPFPALIAFLFVLMTRPAEFFPALGVLRPGFVTSVLAMGLLAGTVAMRRRIEWPRSPQTPLLLGLTVCVVVSSYMGTSPSASLATFQQVFVKILTIYFLILVVVDSPGRVEGLQVALTGACASIALYALYMKVSGEASIEGSRAALVGYLGDPNDLAMTLLMVTPGALESAIRTQGRRRAAWVVAFVVLVSGILSTQSRGGLLSLGLGSTVILYDRIENKAALVAGAALVLAVGGLAAGVTERKSGGSAAHGELDESAQGRLDAWKAGGRMIVRNPVTGVGFARFADNYLMYVSDTLIWKKHETHNAYIKAASETGLPGAFFFLALAGRAWWGARRVRRGADAFETPGQRAAAAGLLGSISGFLMVIFFLSATWYWFPYILFAQVAVTERVWAMRRASEAVDGGHP